MRCSMVSALAEKAMKANASAIIVLRIEPYSGMIRHCPAMRRSIHVLMRRSTEDVDGSRTSPAMTMLNFVT